jgi:hypothetical protein
MKSRFVFAALLLGCSGSSSVMNGTIEGNALSIADSESVVNSRNELSIELTSTTGRCADVAVRRERPSSQDLILVLMRTDAQSNEIPLVTGTYTVADSGPGLQRVQSKYEALDKTCESPGATFATAGIVQLAMLGSDGSASGTFDLFFGADHVTGSFNAAGCPAFLSSSPMPSTCQ